MHLPLAAASRVSSLGLWDPVMGLAWHIIFFFLGCFVPITIYDSRQVVGRQETDRQIPTHGTCILMREELSFFR